MFERFLFSPEHEDFRRSVRCLVQAEMVPFHAQWEDNGQVSREVWRQAGQAGMLCCTIPEEYGGPGGDLLTSVVVIEEMARAGITGPGFNISEYVASYIFRFGTETQKRKWLPGLASGETIAAIGISEPDAGSDVRGIRARMEREGDEIVVTGQKTYISNGQVADVVLTVAKSDPARPREAISLVLVETNRAGFSRGRKLRKLGLKAQDTSELFFDHVRVPAENLVGEEHCGFQYLTSNLAYERLVHAIRGAAVCEVTLEQTIAFTLDRKAFGVTISEFQNTQFKLAELQAATWSARVFLDRCLELALQGKLTEVAAAAAKLTICELQCKVVDECLQLHGGAGYLLDYPVAHAYIDSRINKIGGGTMEVMKQIISRAILPRARRAA